MTLFDDGSLFRDRTDAGEQLARALTAYRARNALVLGIPRGGVVVAGAVARRLDAELDVIVARKLGSPISPELAIGAVTANGGTFLNEELVNQLGVSQEYLAAVTASERAEAQRREARFRGSRPPPCVVGRTVILVDDGLATGATMHAAVRSIRQASPGRVVAAVPVASREACAALRPEVDALVCLHAPEFFGAVGVYYDEFGQTEDAEVTRILGEFAPAAP